MRAEQLVDSDKMISSGLEKFEGKRLLIILPLCEAGGGGNVVLQEASAMQQMGVDVWLFNLEEHKKYFQNSYPNLEFPVIYEDSLKEIRSMQKILMQFVVRYLQAYNIVISLICNTPHV